MDLNQDRRRRRTIAMKSKCLRRSLTSALAIPASSQYYSTGASSLSYPSSLPSSLNNSFFCSSLPRPSSSSASSSRVRDESSLSTTKDVINRPLLVHPSFPLTFNERLNRMVLLTPFGFYRKDMR